MKHPVDTGVQPDQRRFATLYASVVVGLSIVAIVATYLLANSSFDVAVKTRGLSVVIVLLLLLCISLHFWHKRNGPPAAKPETTPDAEVERQLVALDEAHEFFAGSLKSADTFRLIASRVRELVQFRTLTLHILDEGGGRFRVSEADGPGAEHRKGRFTGLSEGLVGTCYLSHVIEIDHRAASARPAIAIPLCNGADIFAVLEMDFELNCDLTQFDPLLLEAIGTRSEPLVLSSLSYERSQANALTDPTTDLPNERAFYLVLENQVAESQRKGSDRPLTILSLDVRSFDEINHRFGHAAGDRVLNFVSQIIKDSLRQMDFFARSNADEFLVVLPTASKEISHDVIARIQTAFFGRKLKITETESIEIELNVGWAAFGSDGETPETLLSVARAKKDQSKSSVPNKVLWFPAELAN